MTTGFSVQDALRLDGRKALVVGGGGHIGRAACQVLAELGARIAIADLNEGGMARTLEERAVAACCADPLPVDLRDADATRAMTRRAIDTLNGLDILIHTAAFVNQANTVGFASPFAEQRIEPWRDALEINLTSAFTIVREAAPTLSEGGAGTVVLFGSIYGLGGPDNRLYEGMEGVGNAAAYAASKGGILQLSRWLATSLAPRVRVNAISPGGIERGQDPTFIDRYAARTPMGRMGTEDDLKGAIAFLSSDLSTYVTGQNIVVDGGWTAW
jgi:NAD(P)-dependent dehydrogenase (short-subunit alcohol dehydrogenase family)